MYIGQRVNTKYGPGTVECFERIDEKLKLSHPENYCDQCRIGVRLDVPENWILSHTTEKPPFFTIDELTPCPTST
jgi:hypothetical protein